ncbi:MAG: pseudouridine-5'-phosphate glycosidase [Chloroflexi bacterium]|nr:pseudouridine-5'-phosphate glycosidase [Chloroflexota bacterium]
MLNNLPPQIRLSAEVERALNLNLPVMAFESTVITHGLPYPENLRLAEDMEGQAYSLGVTPATVAVIDGLARVGLSAADLQFLADQGDRLMKISPRDFAQAALRAASGGTTVAGTMLAAHAAGVRVFATGGIGGVHYDISAAHRGAYDISNDLHTLATIPMIVVCAGAKAILDLPATLETLETWGVPVVGYQTDDFPAFYARKSGLKTSARAETAEEVARFARSHWGMGLRSAVLVTAPPPEDVALPEALVEEAVQAALKEAQKQGVTGKAVTPFLLQKVNETTKGGSMRANLALLLNNAAIGAQIARLVDSRW